ncbi:stage IV sporulation protein FB [Lentibacillus kapialis]|uniref:Stage IV sporulation protein FB n=1 Tax=Lentibacillus kapialis TaxID=340214 RepID=A0A917UTE0_9BACI|nr:site-2 protease family protein [Lentibacillus kapialis]GGJ84088.1 stage IV sporulation protein FB [Lentibacillus kapialis]
MMRSNLLPSVHIHPILLIFIIISFLTGTFIELMVILTIVLIHELGHFSAAKWFGWRIRGVMLWVFGGVMDTDEHGTRPFHEEVYVALAGPLQHVFIYLFLLMLSGSGLLSSYIIETACFYNTAILLFNLLPVWPLDGGKLVLLVLSEKLPYRKAYAFAVMFSLILNIVLTIVVIFVMPFTLSAFLLFSFLAVENRKDWKQRYFVFIRFLLQRYQGDNFFKRVQPIEISSHLRLMDVFSCFRRDRVHKIYVTLPGDIRWQMDEMECLHSYFHDQNYRKSIGEIISRVS